MPKPKKKQLPYVISDYFYFPKKEVDNDKLHKHFKVDHFNDKGCKGCDYKPDRPCDTCQECPNFLGTFKFWRKKEIEGKPYIGVAKGNSVKVQKLMGDIDSDRVIDKRVNRRFQSDLKFILKPYDYQAKATGDMMKFSQGVLEAPPRSGKTIMAIQMVCKKRRKTLIVAHQDDLLNQFYETFTGLRLDGSKSKDFPRATNASKLEKKLGYNPVIVAKKPKDFFGKHDVVLTTYQKFISPGGKKLLKKVAKRFGLVVVDEVHRSSAECYSAMLSRLKPRYVYTLTGTPELKSGMQFVREFIIGPIRHKAKVATLQPELFVYESALSRQVKAKLWVFIVKSLYRDTKRNMDIVKLVIEDVKNGESVLIPATQRQYIDAMVEEINKAWMIETGTSDSIAEAFYRMPKKDAKTDMLNRARKGQTKVTVALRSMLTGVNVPRWSVIYEVSPINNKTNMTQEVMRICTPYEGKSPKIRWFVDKKCDASIRCFLASMAHMKSIPHIISKKNSQKISEVATWVGQNTSSYGNSNSDGLPATFGRPGQRFTL